MAVEGMRVAQQENIQTIVLEQASDQKINLELLHSTDWVVAISILLSCVVSLIGFLITAYIVRKTTEQTIASNKYLISAQNELKLTDLKSDNLLQLRKLIAEYYFQFELFENASGVTIHNHYICEGEVSIEKSQHYIKEDLYQLNALAAKIMIYLDLNVDHHLNIKNDMKKINTAAWEIYVSFDASYAEAQVQLHDFKKAFEELQMHLNNFVLAVQKEIYELK